MDTVRKVPRFSRDRFPISTDIAITMGRNYLVLIKRVNEPYRDKLVLPGGYFDRTDKTTREAAARELLEETNIEVNPEHLELLTVLDAVGRDPRPDAPRISVVYTFDFPMSASIVSWRAWDDARELKVVGLNFLEPDDIGFDHYEVVAMLKERRKVQSFTF